MFGIRGGDVPHIAHSIAVRGKLGICRLAAFIAIHAGDLAVHLALSIYVIRVCLGFHGGLQALYVRFQTLHGGLQALYGRSIGLNPFNRAVRLLAWLCARLRRFKADDRNSAVYNRDTLAVAKHSAASSLERLIRLDDIQRGDAILYYN